MPAGTHPQQGHAQLGGHVGGMQANGSMSLIQILTTTNLYLNRMSLMMDVSGLSLPYREVQTQCFTPSSDSSPDQSRAVGDR
jgi:hypothetical protein